MDNERLATLARWRSIVAARDPAAAEGWDDEPFPHFLHAFRPDGVGLAPLLDGVPKGQEMLTRLLEVYAVAGAQDRGDAYFVVRTPRRASVDQLRNWAQQYLRAMGAMARALMENGGGFAEGREVEVGLLLQEAHLVDVVPGPPPLESPAAVSPMSTILYELTTEYAGGLRGLSVEGELLKDPLYYLACEYELAYYVLWPQLSESTPLHEPYSGWFELWRCGAELHHRDDATGWRLAEDGVFRLYVPRSVLEGAPPSQLAALRAVRPAPKATAEVTGEALPPIAELWRRIEAWLMDNARPVLSELRPGASSDELNALESAIGLALPASLRESLLIHDGTSPEVGLLGGRELLNVAQMRWLWKEECAATTTPEGRQRIPIVLHDEEGTPLFLCVDVSGRVMASWRVGADPIVIAPSYHAWLNSFTEDLEQGRLGYDGNWVVAGGAATLPERTSKDLARLLDQLLQHEALELEPPTTVADLIPTLHKALASLETDEDRATCLSTALLAHPGVAELYVDEDELRRLVTKFL